MRLFQKLSELEKKGAPIRVGLVGAGQMGKYMVAVMKQMQGIQLVAVADKVLDHAKSALQASGYTGVEINSSQDASMDRLQAGEVYITPAAALIPKLDFVDVVIEATGVPEVGAQVSFMSILARKHVVMLSYETVVTVGHILSHLAKAAGVVFTGAAGDEPAAILELYDFARAMGFEVVAAGKGKNNPLDRSATPDSVAEDAAEVGTSARMHCSFVDGSKTMVEMAAVANATGLVPDVRGMHGPVTEVKSLPKVFSLVSQGGVLQQKGVVDYARGEIAPGVFVIITTDNPLIREDLWFERMGDGPNYLLFRPYHLCDMETPLSAVLAQVYGEPTLIPLGQPVAEVFTVAKRDLKAGEVLDGFGGYTMYGEIDRASVVREQRLLPGGLAKGCQLLVDVPKGCPITYDMVSLPRDSFVVHLRAMQDQLVAESFFKSDC